MKGLSVLMKRHGDTLAVLAEFLDVNVNTVWRWRVGQNVPVIEVQQRLCERYGCTFDELLNGPTKNELTIEFHWEVEDMDVLKIESNHFNFGFRGKDVLLWGALSDDEDDETVARAIMRQIRAARVGKRAANAALEEMQGKKVDNQ